MKTFKLVSLQLVTEDGEAEEIELVDGLIINKENEASTWLIEALMNTEQYELVKKQLEGKGDSFIISCVITKKDNTPAFFEAFFRNAREMEDYVSVLFSGKLRNRRREMAELLLDDLIDEGLTGAQLKSAFRDSLRSGNR
ncbi:hypothetical protein AC622_00820 [Bacillus sp. FJAT-27916]|uniref:YwpF family protein n=1 Tax=Bacillus sp. FJAT-27916 TaxID=1679169 RepID=UPI00067147B0|nr:YwpF family protein [Bacillus sp. FJAT-27916]KMY42986.1 hypothetical protein AC622_00820 [Bacillus sp. FJAT-27916]